jgi:hypothetical protein
VTSALARSSKIEPAKSEPAQQAPWKPCGPVAGEGRFFWDRDHSQMEGHRQPFASCKFIAEAASFTLRFWAKTVIDRHAPKERRKDYRA